MDILYSGGLLPAVLSKLTNGLSTGTDGGGATHILDAVPALLMNDEVRGLLHQLLLKSTIGYRVHAARLLHSVGDPEGIRHITYNSLRVHPILGVDQSSISGWFGYTKRYAADLPADCIAMLVNEMSNEQPTFHGDTLAQLASEKIVPLVRPLLSMHVSASRYAAYVLAMHGDKDVMPILIDWLWSDQSPPLALIALSHLGDLAISPLEKLAATYEAQAGKQSLQRQIDFRLAYLKSNRSSIVPLFERFFRARLDTIVAYNKQTRPPYANRKLQVPIEPFVLNHDGIFHRPYPPNALLEFGSDADRNYLVDIQTQEIEKLFAQGVGYDDLLSCRLCPFVFVVPSTGRGEEQGESFYNLPGFEIRYDRHDYVRASTNWLSNPQLYIL